VSFGKGGKTESFTGAFRINPREAVRPEDLDGFLHSPSEHLTLSVALIRKLSPDSLSVMEFKTPQDVAIAETFMLFPLLGQQLSDAWNVKFGREFDMTNDSHLFKTTPGKGRLPLYEGKMIHQFDHSRAQPKYWLDEGEARAALLGKRKDEGQRLEYQGYRLAFRDVARNTDARTAIMTMLVRNVFCNHTLPTTWVMHRNGEEFDAKSGLLFCALMNSLIVDFLLRQRVTTHLTFILLYQLPVPRITPTDPAFNPIVDRAARLICTTPEFDDLAGEVGLADHNDGVTDEPERARLRAELDALVAHLYGLTEEEFAYIMTTFPLLDQSVKEAALDAYRRFAPDPAAKQLAALVVRGESAQLEFKVAACWNPATKAKDGTLKENIVQGIAAFLNSKEGGALLIGVASDGTIVGLADDFKAANPQKPGPDSYELFLRNAVGNQLGADCGPFCEISFHDLGGRDVCRVRVKSATRPVYLNGDLYVRDGNKKSKLKAKEAVDYIKHRWG
jgi:hypothetical protein